MAGGDDELARSYLTRRWVGLSQGVNYAWLHEGQNVVGWMGRRDALNRA
jgi:hypothetical protein